MVAHKKYKKNTCIAFMYYAVHLKPRIFSGFPWTEFIINQTAVDQ